MKISYHGRGEDWCHLCGVRAPKLADIWFPENAEHQKENVNYIRICSSCAKAIIAVCEVNQ